jgi:hypothetical protein
MATNSQDVILITVFINNSPEWICDVHFKVDELLNQQNVSIFRKLDFGNIERCLESDVIDKFPSLSKINTDRVLHAVSLKHSHESPRVRAFAESAAFFVCKFRALNYADRLILQVKNVTVHQVFVENKQLIRSRVL